MPDVSNKYRNLIAAVIIIMIWAGIILLISSNSKGALGDGFALYSWIALTRLGALIGGAILLLLRVVRVLKQKMNFFYVLAGTLNVCLGILGIVLFLSSGTGSTILHEFLPTLLIAVLIMGDIFFL